MNYGIYTQEGIKKEIIRITEDGCNITYIHQNVTRNYKNPEEKVQAEIFCKLVLWYKYPVGKIGLYVPVTDGSTKNRPISLSIMILLIHHRLLLSNAKKKMFLNKNLHKPLIRLFHMHILPQVLLNMYGLHQVSKMHILNLIKKAVLEKLFPIYLNTV